MKIYQIRKLKIIKYAEKKRIFWNLQYKNLINSRYVLQ